MCARRLVFLAATLLVLSSAAPFAHHSVSGQFDVTKSVTLTGTIRKVDWMNPHVYVYLDVKADDGTTTTWALETAPTAFLRKAGLSKDSLAGKPGDVITVTGHPGRTAGKNLAWILRITYPDGRFYQLSADR